MLLNWKWASQEPSTNVGGLGGGVEGRVSELVPLGTREEVSTGRDRCCQSLPKGDWPVLAVEQRFRGGLGVTLLGFSFCLFRAPGKPPL